MIMFDFGDTLIPQPLFETCLTHDRFVGFVAPHLVRLLIGNDQRQLLPAAALAGGTLVVLADTFARSAFAPVQLPVGVVTALFGVPVFLWLLRRW